MESLINKVNNKCICFNNLAGRLDTKDDFLRGSVEEKKAGLSEKR